MQVEKPLSWQEVRTSSPTGRESFPYSTPVDVLLASEETFDTHTKKNTLLCALLESDRVHVDSYRMYRSLTAQGCKAPLVNTFEHNLCVSASATFSRHIEQVQGKKMKNVKPQFSQKG